MMNTSTAGGVARLALLFARNQNDINANAINLVGTFAASVSIIQRNCARMGSVCAQLGLDF